MEPIDLQTFRRLFPEYRDRSDAWVTERLGNLSPEQVRLIQQRAAGQPLPPVGEGGNVHTTTRPGAGMPPQVQGLFPTLWDATKSLGTGLAEGAYDLVTAPVTVLEPALRGADWLSEQITGQPPPDDWTQNPVFDATRSGREFLTDRLYQPQTRWGDMTRTIGTFLPGSTLGPGSLPGNLMRYGLLPALASEAGGLMAEGSDWEPYIRAGMAILTGGVMAAQSASSAGVGVPGTAPGAASILARRLRSSGVTPQELTAADQLVQQARGQGINISWQEAFHQVTGGRVDLSDLQRVVEQSRGGREIMSDFYAGRPGTARTAFETTVSAVGPASSPAALGNLMEDLATGAIDRVRRDINAITEPLYLRSSATQVDPAAFARLSSDPLFQRAVKTIRADPALSRYVSGYGDDSVAMMDQVKKWLEELAGLPAPDRTQTVSSTYRAVAGEARRAATGVSGEYAQALASQEAMRRDWLAPLSAGPLGKMAGTNDLESQIRGLFPRDPFSGTDREVTAAIRAISDQNPAAAGAVVRQYLEQTFNRATRDLQGGANQFGPAGFRVAIEGNPQQARNLEAAIRALPGGDAIYEGFRKLLDVFDASGLRPRQNSATAFNQAVQAQLATGAPLGTAVSYAASPLEALGAVRSFVADLQTGRNTAALARILTDPSALPLLKRLAQGGLRQDLLSVAAALLQQGNVTMQQHWAPPRLGQNAVLSGAPLLQ